MMLYHIIYYIIIVYLIIRIFHIKWQMKKNEDTSFHFHPFHRAEAWSPRAIRINGWRYSGMLEADLVVRAVCSGFIHMHLGKQSARIVEEATVQRDLLNFTFAFQRLQEHGRTCFCSGFFGLKQAE